jgi:hypothetical protein
MLLAFKSVPVASGGATTGEPRIRLRVLRRDKPAPG